MKLARLARELASSLKHRRRPARGVRILAYHGVVERRADPRVEQSFHLISEFRAHLEILRRCTVVPLQELEDSRDGGLRPRVAVTFDDGFRNNILAAELLDAARLPVTIFVSTENVETGETIWPTLSRLVLACGSARTVRVGGITYELDRDPAAFRALRSVMKRSAAASRELLWNELVAQLRDGELEELRSRFPSLAMMTWAEARSLQTAGITFGSHGMRHELQHADQPSLLRLRELETSKAQIERELGCECRHFAFPNGTYNDHSSSEVRNSGYVAGFTTVPRAANPDDNVMLLPRLTPGPTAEKVAAALLFGT